MKNQVSLSVPLTINAFTNQIKTVLAKDRCEITLVSPDYIVFDASTKICLKMNSLIYQYREEHYETFIIPPDSIYTPICKSDDCQKLVENIQQVKQVEKNTNSAYNANNNKQSTGEQNKSANRHDQQKLQKESQSQKGQDQENNQETTQQQNNGVKTYKQNQENYDNITQLQNISVIYTISIKKTEKFDDEQFQSFIDMLETYLEVKDFVKRSDIGQNSDPLYSAIAKHCPLTQSQQIGIIKQEPFINTSKIVGAAFAAFSSFLPSKNKTEIPKQQKIQQAGDHKQVKVQKCSQPENNQEEKTSRWQIFKRKCSDINMAMTQSLKPINSKVKNLSDQIGEKFDTSDNQIIKGLRKWSKKTQQVLNQGYLGEENQIRRSSITQSNIDTQKKEQKQQESQQYSQKLQKTQEVKEQKPKQAQKQISTQENDQKKQTKTEKEQKPSQEQKQNPIQKQQAKVQKQQQQKQQIQKIKVQKQQNSQEQNN